VDLRYYAPGPGIFTFRTVVLSLILLELNVEVIIHPVNELPTFHTRFFRSLARGKYFLSKVAIVQYSRCLIDPMDCEGEKTFERAEDSLLQISFTSGS
jgi:hypothetical protein